MENQNEFEDKNMHEPKEISGNVFTEAGTEDQDIGPVNETEHILPEEEEGDNRFMNNEEEIDDPLASDEELNLEEPLEDENLSEFDEEEE